MRIHHPVGELLYSKGSPLNKHAIAIIIIQISEFARMREVAIGISSGSRSSSSSIVAWNNH